MQPLVSIVTPCYNSSKYISEAIESVIAQSHYHWEMLIVDDCSGDSSAEIVGNYAKADTRIRLFKLGKNSGAGYARDYAVQRATGDYIAFLDADDRWYPNKLEKQLEWMRKHFQPFSFSFYDLMDEDGTPLNKQVTAPLNLTYRQLFFCNFVGNLTGIYDVRHFGKIGISDIRKRQDWILWLKVVKQIGKVQPVPESLAVYRVRKDSISASKIKLLKYNYAVYRDFHKLNPVYALACMLLFIFTQLFIKPRYIINNNLR